MDFLDAGSTDNSVFKNKSSYCVSYEIKKMQQVAFDSFYLSRYESDAQSQHQSKFATNQEEKKESLNVAD